MVCVVQGLARGGGIEQKLNPLPLCSTCTVDMNENCELVVERTLVDNTIWSQSFVVEELKLNPQLSSVAALTTRLKVKYSEVRTSNLQYVDFFF